MENSTYSSTEWKKPFHDDNDTLSENSDSGLITESSSRRWNTRKMQRPNVRVIFETILVIAIIVLSSLLLADKIKQISRQKRFGPTLPEKVVTFGNKAGFGPELVYADDEMSKNATRVREIHENWQALYPKGRGYVLVDEDNGEFVVNNPPFDIDDDHIETTDGRGQGWILAVYRQLHCLVSP